ncbi:trichohyalin-like [Melitaea cinxia]|uniref:trichohyalin-like n=1 Tax=Melitaea cinxia TaxID=113334 RepID=UPI001E272D35|nr:trichohyalin-like [Melitaea cinxia]
MAEENRANRASAETSFSDQEASDRQEQFKIERNIQYGQAMQRQLANQQQQKQFEREDRIFANKMIDEEIRTIADEDQRELQHKHDQTEIMRNEMIMFQKEREAFKEKQKEMVVIEDRKIEEQRQVGYDRSCAIEEERERKFHVQDEKNDRVLTKMVADEAARQDRDDLITLHQNQDRRDRNIQDDLEEEIRVHRDNAENQEGLLSQMEYKKNRALQEKERDVGLRRSMEERMADEDLVEDEYQRKVKAENYQYGADLRKQIQDNADRRSKEKAFDKKRNADDYEPKTELQKNAIAEARRKELESYQRAIDIQWLNSRMEDGRMGRCLALIRKEAEMEKDFQERTDHAAIVDARAKKEIALSVQIAKEKREEACQLLRRHYLREHDPSLRELVKKLQAGYVRRDQQQQILHNQYRRLQEKAEENRANRALAEASYNDQEESDRQEQLKIERNTEYGLAIQQQLVNKQQQKQCEYEDMLCEKRMIDDEMRTIADEDQRELQHKHDQTEIMRNEMIIFQKEREAWKKKQKEMVVIEDRKIEEQRQVASDRSSAIVAEREKKMQLKDESNEKVATKMLADEAARQHRDDLITQLQYQECLERNIQDDLEEEERVQKAKTETKEGLLSQMEYKKNSVLEEQERDAGFRRSMELQMADEDVKEEERKRKIKAQNDQYFSDLQQQIQDNAARRAKEKAIENKRDAEDNVKYQEWRKEVSEERQKIMEEHVPKLLGYVQPGVITPEDVANPRLASLGVNITCNRPKRLPKCNAQCRILREY